MKKIVLLLLVLSLVSVMTSCYFLDQFHYCESMCSECGGCQDLDCIVGICANKCDGNHPVHEHSLTKVDGKFATCVESGYEAYFTCECGKLFSDEAGENEIESPVVVEALGHTEETVAGKDATCTEAGLTEGKKCSVCGVTTKAQDTISAKGHTNAQAVKENEVAPNCTDKGSYDNVVYCSVCSAEVSRETIPVDALGHKEETVPGKAATCTESGLTEGKKCSVCGVTTLEQETIPAKGHVYDDYRDESCNNCDYIRNVECLHENKVAIGEAQNATCTENGITAGEKCADCGEIFVAQEVIPAKGHTDETVAGKDATCTEAGLKDGKKCTVCGVTTLEQETVPAKGHTEETVAGKDATCTEAGLTEGKKCSVCGDTLVAQTVVDALGHSFSEEAVKGDDGNFYLVCTRNCGEREFSHYGATINNEFNSDKSNSLNIVYDDFGAWGVTTSGNHEINLKAGSPASGAIGGLDKTGAYVYYEFVMDEAGVVDFIWNIAGSNWNSSTNSNDGLADMAAHMTVTIDGKPIDISGIALSAEGEHSWWNLQNLIIENVSLDAGVHTFKCDITAAGGLNVASMTINATSDVYVRSADVTNATISIEGDKVYFVLTFINNGYAKEEVKIWHNATAAYDIAYFDTVNGVSTLKVDVTDLELGTQISPHLSFAGKNYVNGANKNGDVRDGSLEYDFQAFTVNGKGYVIFEYYSMPSLLVCENYMKLQGVDLVEEDGTLYYAITYQMAGYDPDDIQFFDKSVYEIAKIDNNSGVYTFKIDATKYSSIWPHLKVNGNKWDGVNNKASSNGDVIFSVQTKSVTFNGKVYTLKTQYSMPTLTSATA